MNEGQLSEYQTSLAEQIATFAVSNQSKENVAAFARERLKEYHAEVFNYFMLHYPGPVSVIRQP